MKKRMMALACCVCLVLGLTACGDKKNDNTESEKMRSGQYELDLDKLVTKLADYSNIAVELSKDYETTDESVEDTYNSLVSGISSYTEVEDRDTIKDGDYVLVDYTGYWKDEAFAGGSAKQQYVWCAKNNGYIEGFTDGLIGKKVGDTTKYDVTFPDPYPNNTDLSGEVTQFEFVIYGIYEKKTIDPKDVADSDIKDNFYSSYGVSTVKEFKEFIKSALISNNESNKYQETLSQIKKYMFDNSEVTIPDDYFNLRLEEYIDQFTTRNVPEGKTLEEYISSTYQMTLDEAKEEWKTYLTDNIKTELIFEKIANELKIEIDEKEYAEYEKSLISSLDVKDADNMYTSFGNGNADEGKAYVTRLYRVNSAIDYVIEHATVTVAKTQS